MPPKRQTRLRIAAHVRGFPARAPIAVDDKAALVQFFQVDEARGDGARGKGRGGEADGFGLVDARGLGVREPGVELGEGGWGELGAVQGAFGVLVGLFGGGVGGWGDCWGWSRGLVGVEGEEGKRRRVGGCPSELTYEFGRLGGGHAVYVEESEA